MTTEKERIIDAVTQDEHKNVIGALNNLEREVRGTVRAQAEIRSQYSRCSFAYKDLHLHLLLETHECEDYPDEEREEDDKTVAQKLLEEIENRLELLSGVINREEF